MLAEVAASKTGSQSQWDKQIPHAPPKTRAPRAEWIYSSSVAYQRRIAPFRTSVQMEAHHQRTEREPVKLKFGIDRLLSNDVSKSVTTPVAKPLATVAVPCSDCVTSLFRCCRLSPSRGGHDQQQGYHHGFGATSANGIYTVQPIRPFATRPGEYSSMKE